MADFQRVPVDQPLPRSWLPALGSTVAALLAVAIVKPWGEPPPPADPGPSILPSAVAGSPEPARPGDREPYEPRLFGHREPEPAWELWPAGYVVEFGISGPTPLDALDGPAPRPSQAPPEASPDPSPGGGAAPGPAAGPVPEGIVDLGPTDQLVALGINTPGDVRIHGIRLVLLDDSCCLGATRPIAVTVPLLRLPTLWESGHFHVIGVRDSLRPGQPGRWPVGEYRLVLELSIGETREIRLRVGSPTA